MVNYEERDAMKALRGPLSKRATSAEFNEWMAREVCEYIDQLRNRLDLAAFKQRLERDDTNEQELGDATQRAIKIVRRLELLAAHAKARDYTVAVWFDPRIDEWSVRAGDMQVAVGSNLMAALWAWFDAWSNDDAN